MTRMTDAFTADVASNPDVIEAYLANVTKREKGLEGEDEGEDAAPEGHDDNGAETVADVLARLRGRGSGTDQPGTPRHRAD